VLCIHESRHFDTDPDLAFLLVAFKLPKKISFLKVFFAYYFLKVHLHPSSKIKVYKEVTKQ
jgi:hypothetical protein